MKFIEIKNDQGAKYAFFQLETDKEKQFFKNFNLLSQDCSLDKVSKPVVNWLFVFGSPALLSYENDVIAIKYNNDSHSPLMFNPSNIIFTFLKEIYTLGITETDMEADLKAAVNLEAQTSKPMHT